MLKPRISGRVSGLQSYPKEQDQSSCPLQVHHLPQDRGCEKHTESCMALQHPVRALCNGDYDRSARQYKLRSKGQGCVSRVLGLKNEGRSAIKALEDPAQ